MLACSALIFSVTGRQCAGGDRTGRAGCCAADSDPLDASQHQSYVRLRGTALEGRGRHSSLGILSRVLGTDARMDPVGVAAVVSAMPHLPHLSDVNLACTCVPHRAIVAAACPMSLTFGLGLSVCLCGWCACSHPWQSNGRPDAGRDAAAVHGIAAAQHRQPGQRYRRECGLGELGHPR